MSRIRRSQNSVVRRQVHVVGSSAGGDEIATLPELSLRSVSAQTLKRRRRNDEQNAVSNSL